MLLTHLTFHLAAVSSGCKWEKTSDLKANKRRRFLGSDEEIYKIRKCLCYFWRPWTGSVHLQDLGLREAELGLMLVDELHQGFHVHGVVQIEVLLPRVLQLGDGNGLTHCREGAEASG